MLLTKLFTGKSQTETLRIDRALAGSIQEGKGLRFSWKDRLLEVKELFIYIYGFLLCFYGLVIDLWALLIALLDRARGLYGRILTEVKILPYHG